MDLHGALDIFGLPHLLRAVEICRKSFSLEILHPAARAGLCIQDGRIFWARVGSEEGEEALRTMCRWPGADFWIYPLSAELAVENAIVASEYFERFPELVSGAAAALPTDSVEGQVGVLGMRELLHVYRLSGRPATIRLGSSQGKGELQVSSGLVLLARWGKLEGRDALEPLLQQATGGLRIAPGSPAGFADEPIDLGPLLGVEEPSSAPPENGDLPEETTPDDPDDPDDPDEIALEEASGPVPGCDHETRTFRAMKLPRQVKIARQGNTKQRITAACSPNDRVAMAVVADRNFTADLAEAIASNPTANPKVLDFLGSDVSTRGSYSIAHHLATNPATPLDTSVELLIRLSDRDLRLILQNGYSHPQALRSKARQILETRKKKRAF